EAHLMPEHRARAGAGTVALLHPLAEDAFHQLVILAHSGARPTQGMRQHSAVRRPGEARASPRCGRRTSPTRIGRIAPAWGFRRPIVPRAAALSRLLFAPLEKLAVQPVLVLGGHVGLAGALHELDEVGLRQVAGIV